MIIAVDFDGTLSMGPYPEIGNPKPYAVEMMNKLKDDGHYIILWTCRRGERLEDALNWWAWPEHWRRGAWDSDFVTGIKTVETAFNRPFKKEEKGLEDAILTALKEMIGEEPGTIEKALERHYRRELLDIAGELDGKYGAKTAASLVREAAEVYEKRGRLKKF